MKIYLAAPPSKYYHIVNKILFSFFMIIYPDQKWGAKSDFKYLKKQSDKNEHK